MRVFPFRKMPDFLEYTPVVSAIEAVWVKGCNLNSLLDFGV
jgi:hypothetical protein